MLTSSIPQTSDLIGSDSGNRNRRAPAKSRAQPIIQVRPATAADIEAYYGEPPSGTLRATVAEMDGQIVGVIGIIREAAVGRFFCDFKPKLQPYLRSITIMRAVKDSMAYADQYRGPVVAIAEHAEGCRIMNRLGWTHLQGELYGWLN